MGTLSIYTSIFLSVVFIFGYVGIIFEHKIKISKSATALLLGVVCWIIYFTYTTATYSESMNNLSEHVWDISQIVLFLLGAMTLVEIIDLHNGFKIITDWVKSKSKRKMIWIISLVAFFMSSILDNLTTTILMISLLRKLVPAKERLIPGGLVVIAANAGGAWTPIGDVTTTMLWIGDKISTLSIMHSLFIPSMISLLIPLIIFSFFYKGRYETEKDVENVQKKEEHGARIVLVLGLLGLIFVPVFKILTGLPPFMGILFSLGIVWLVTDFMHFKEESRQHLRVHKVLTRIDMSAIIFFLGILLAVDALQASGILGKLSEILSVKVPNLTVLATLIGFLSSIVDNVPLVAAVMRMYSQFPMDAGLWHMIAYTAGTGGSLLIIGSAAGVAFMSLEKVNFFSYMKIITIPAALGYLIGIIFYAIAFG